MAVWISEIGLGKGGIAMGTSGGGAGGGSGGSGGGGGGGGGGAGFVTIVGSSITEVDRKKEKAWTALQKVFSRLSQDYISFISSDPGVAAAYESLHSLHVMLVQEHSWEKVEKRWKVPGGEGCLMALAKALTREDGPTPVHPRLVASLQASLQDFFLRIVKYNVLVRDTGDAAAVLAKLDPTPFQSISALFLAHYLAETLRIEEPGISRSALAHIREFSEAKANQLVASFETKFKGKQWNDIDKIGYKHLFRIMRGEPEWLSGRLRKEI